MTSYEENKTRVKVGAVIPAYNGAGPLAACIDSLLAQTYPLARIFVIDNASSDETPALMRGYAGSVVDSRRLPVNSGPAGGFVQGMQAAMEEHCDFIWMMDQDSTAQPETLAKLIECMLADKSRVAAAPAKLETDGALWVGENLIGSVGAGKDLYDGPPFEIESTLWSGLLVRAEAVKQAGLPRAELFGWWCDGEYCFRLRKQGPIIVVPQSRIHHHPTGAVHLQFSGYWKHYYYQRNSMYLYLRGYLPSPGVASMIVNLAKQVAYIVLRQDHKLQRLRILLTAALHAFSGQMGRGPAWLH